MVPNPAFLAQLAAGLPDKGAAVLVGCKSGARSIQALAALEAAGYTQLAHNSRGWDGWLEAGLPVEV
jgi:rhodanese-related sulfurtransferase